MAGLAAKFGDGGNHAFRFEEAFVAGIDQGGKGFGIGGELGERGVIVILSGLGPFPSAFLHEPQANDIAQ